jgi:hypothetical protein
VLDELGRQRRRAKARAAWSTVWSPLPRGGRNLSSMPGMSSASARAVRMIASSSSRSASRATAFETVPSRAEPRPENCVTA